MTWAITLTTHGAKERTVGAPALVTVDGDQPAVTAPDPAVCSAVQCTATAMYIPLACHLLPHGS